MIEKMTSLKSRLYIALFPIMPPEAVVVKDLRSCAVRQERREKKQSCP